MDTYRIIVNPGHSTALTYIHRCGIWSQLDPDRILIFTIWHRNQIQTGATKTTRYLTVSGFSEPLPFSVEVLVHDIPDKA